MSESLTALFFRTGKCVRLPPKVTLTNLDVATAVVSNCGEDSIHGVILNRKSIEVAVTSEAAFDRLITYPSILEQHGGFELHFEPCYTDQFKVTMYNVPINATGATETAIIAAAGGTVISHSIHRAQTAAGSFLTGERIFLCSGRATFTSLPLAIKAYDG